MQPGNFIAELRVQPLGQVFREQRMVTIPSAFLIEGHEQQLALLRALDKELRQRDPERWRTKQVSDFLSGIWAQGYGMMYADAIRAVRVARIAGRVIVVLFVALTIARLALASTRGPSRDGPRVDAGAKPEDQHDTTA